MRAAWVAAERASEVREAARDWKKAGAIDETTLAAIPAGSAGILASVSSEASTGTPREMAITLSPAT